MPPVCVVHLHAIVINSDLPGRELNDAAEHHAEHGGQSNYGDVATGSPLTAVECPPEGHEKKPPTQASSAQGPQ
jgi:hypothetical protein